LSGNPSIAKRAPVTGLAVLLVYTILHIVEGYVLTPLLTRATVRLPPAFTLATQVILASLVGVIGITFSTPLLVTVVSMAKAWRNRAKALPG